MKTTLLTAIAAACLNVSLFVQAVSAGATDLGRRVTIDVTNAPPQSVFNLLARVLQCKVKVDPALKTPITLRMVDARIDTDKALIAQIPNAEGVVMIRTPNSGMAQRRYLPRPPPDRSKAQTTP